MVDKIYGMQTGLGLWEFGGPPHQRVNLREYFQKIFHAEKELIWLLVHFLAQNEALTTQCAIQ